jgi:hypothetical protein
VEIATRSHYDEAEAEELLATDSANEAVLQGRGPESFVSQCVSCLSYRTQSRSINREAAISKPEP